jgi:hypothetical protein
MQETRSAAEGYETRGQVARATDQTDWSRPKR